RRCTMIFLAMMLRIPQLRSPARSRVRNQIRNAAAALALCAALSAFADKKPQLVKPMAGPRATALRVTWIYVSPDRGAQKVDRVQVGREMVMAEKSGPWMRVYANTD